MATSRSTSIDPTLFFIPPDVIDFRSQTRDPNADEPTEYDPGLDDTDGEVDVPDDGSDDLATPSWLNVVSQTARSSSDGRTVVDVVVEVEDILGALTYEVRVTR